MSESTVTPTVRKSVSPERSQTSLKTHNTDDNTSTPRTLSRLSTEPRQASVSMFTGRSDGPNTSPSISQKREARQSVISPGTIDRVFPIRSAVSIDPNVTPTARHESGENFPGLRLGGDSTIAARRASTFSRSNTTTSNGGKPSPPYRSGGSPPRRISISSSSRPHLDHSNPRTPDERRISENSEPVIGTVNNQVMTAILTDDNSEHNDNESSVSGGMSLTSRSPSFKMDGEGLVTARFRHVVTDGGHAVITGRDGETLQRCEDEPIHIPGAIQSFGLLIAFREQEGKLIVRVASENSAKIIGYTPAQLFKLDNFLNIFTEEQADNLLDHLDFIRDEEAADVATNGPEVFMLSIRPPHHKTRKLWCAMHIPDTDKSMVICEFELEEDKENPLVASDDRTPEPPEDTLGCNPTEEELLESTVNVSKPLRVLRSARKKRGEAAAMEVFNIMSQVQEQLTNAPNLELFLRVLIGVVKELTGFHRVMIYQFDRAWNGRVVSELVDPRATKDLYKGLNFPASDIPKQARDLYKLNKVRSLYDRDQETARLVCRTMEDLEAPLDLSHAYLRAMSPIHLKYLANMAVRASMSISITAFDELWGLIACHSYGTRGMRVSFPIRKMCRLVGDTASRNIERLSYASRLQARKLINTTSSAANPSGYIVASSEDLLKLFDADIGVLSIRDETKIMGQSHSHLQEILAVVEYLRMRKLNAVCTSQDITMDFPDLRFSPGLKFFAGLLYVPLSNGGSDFIAFFRKGVLQEVKWAGNPYEKFIKEGTEGYLEPRKSFKTWSETIVGRCRDWSEEEIETASVLCLVYGKFIEVWRQKEAALHNSRLTRLLLANSAHEVRTPLNHIINYLEIALEGTLDQETRDNLAKSHSASKSLVYVINDLLDLTKTEDGKGLVKEEPFDFIATIKEATDPFAGDAKRKGIKYYVQIQPDIPTQVVGDHRRFRQAVSNLIANAVQHTTSGSVFVEVSKLPETTSERCEIELVVEDTGAGMSQDKVDMLFRELEEVSYETNASDTKLLESNSSSGTERAALGLGLAVVARTIRAMNGQMRLKTEEGKGSRFMIQLGFDIPAAQDMRLPPIPSPTEPGKFSSSTFGSEVTLVSRNPTNPKRSDPAKLIRRESGDSMNSLTSLKSGKSNKSITSMHSNTSQKSDADRLIDAIQEPFRLSDDTAGPPSENQSRRTKSVNHENAPARHQFSSSTGSLRELKSAFHKIPGQERITDSGVPLKPVRVPDETSANDSSSQKAGKVFFDIQPRVEEVQTSQEQQDDSSAENLSVLVAEDDPINSKIMKRRLEKLGHMVHLTVNGEECSSAFGEHVTSADVILMDLQMPIVDGFSATKMIRSLEKTQSSTTISKRAAANGRIPIFAVSASLVERERQKYIDAGFDGWILKPVDFKRVELFFNGIVDPEVRATCLYQPGAWEQGGWFFGREEQKEKLHVDTAPSDEKPTLESEKDLENGRSGEPTSSAGSVTPTLPAKNENNENGKEELTPPVKS